jgi:NADH:ubiquinone oxidoreductase subunit H
MSDWITANQVLILTVIKVVVLLILLLTGVAYAVWFERKLIAQIQSRWGPYRVGPFGLLQPLADGLKFFFKEDINLPHVTSRFIYLLAPFLAVTLALLAVAVIPFGPDQISILGLTTGLHIAHRRHQHWHPLHSGGDLADGLLRRPGRLVVEQQVSFDRRFAQFRPDDQL